MPKLDTALAALYMSRVGAELLLGNIVEQINDAARTDTAAADGETWLYRSGATIVRQTFDKESGAWRSVTQS
jgi:hypothetical protein